MGDQQPVEAHGVGGEPPPPAGASQSHQWPSFNFDFETLNISFNGCGFLGIYHVGVATALRTFVPNFKIENACGASAGALAAVCLLGNVPTDAIAYELMKSCHECRKMFLGPFNPKFDVCQRLREGMMKLLPDDIHIRSNGRLHVSVTSVYTGENVLINNFVSKEEVVDAVVASTFIPVFSGIVPSRFRGVPVIDGGFSINQVVLDESTTLTVSPFSGDAHICPMDHDATEIMRLYIANAGTNITVNNLKRLTQVLYPPQSKVLSDLLTSGFHDCIRFLSYYGIVDRASCIRVESHLHHPQHMHQQQHLGGQKNSMVSAAVPDHIRLPTMVNNVLRAFLDTQEEGSSAGDEGKNVNAQRNYVTSLAIKAVWGFVYYQPLLMMMRGSYQASVWIVRQLTNYLVQWLPYIMDSAEEVPVVGNRPVKAATNPVAHVVVRLIGSLIGLFGPIIGFDYVTVHQSEVIRMRRVRARQKVGGLSGEDLAEPQALAEADLDRAKATITVQIHSYEQPSHYSLENVGRPPSHHFSSTGRKITVSPSMLDRRSKSGCTSPLPHNLRQRLQAKRHSIASGSLETLVWRRLGDQNDDTPDGGPSKASIARRRHPSVPETPPFPRCSSMDEDTNEGEDVDDEVSLDSDDETKWLTMEMEAYVDDNDAHPRDLEEAVRLQLEHLQSVVQSKEASRVVTRRGSIFASRIHSGLQTASGRSTAGVSRQHSGTQTPVNEPLNVFSGSTDALEVMNLDNSAETVQNIARAAREHQTVLKSFYEDENGDLVTVALYDVSEENPIDLIGKELLEPTASDSGDQGDLVDLDDGNPEDVQERLRQLRELYGGGGGGVGAMGGSYHQHHHHHHHRHIASSSIDEEDEDDNKAVA